MIAAHSASNVLDAMTLTVGNCCWLSCIVKSLLQASLASSPQATLASCTAEQLRSHEMMASSPGLGYRSVRIMWNATSFQSSLPSNPGLTPPHSKPISEDVYNESSGIVYSVKMHTLYSERRTPCMVLGKNLCYGPESVSDEAEGTRPNLFSIVR